MKDMVLLRSENIVIPAVLSDTVAARDFKRRLPLAVSGTRSAGSYCFPAAIGRFDPDETQVGWKNGDISISGGWLRVFFDGEEASESSVGVMVIAHIDGQGLNLIKQLPDNVRLKIEKQRALAEAHEMGGKI